MILPLNSIELQRQCDQFNSAQKIGSNVVLLKDNGEKIETSTRTPAIVISGHTAVIWLDGFSSCQLLERVSPILK